MWLGIFFNLNWAWEGITSLALSLEGNTEDNSVVINFNRWSLDYPPTSECTYTLAQHLKTRIKSNLPTLHYIFNEHEWPFQYFKLEFHAWVFWIFWHTDRNGNKLLFYQSCPYLLAQKLKGTLSYVSNSKTETACCLSASETIFYKHGTLPQADWTLNHVGLPTLQIIWNVLHVLWLQKYLFHGLSSSI